MGSSRRFPLSEGLGRSLRERKVQGRGGFQQFVLDLQNRLNAKNEIEADDALLERLEHYAFDFGQGGWQTLLRDLLDEIEPRLRSVP